MGDGRFGDPGPGFGGANPGVNRPVVGQNPQGPPGAPGRSPDPTQSSPIVRPYAVTGGRTKPRYDLPIEALISVAPYPPRDHATLTPEGQAIVRLCREWRSVAEISALLRLPLGVARVLIADMAHEGLVRVHQASSTEGQPDLKLLERVLSGLRRL